MIRVLGIIPGLGAFFFLAAGIWMLVAMVIAVRQALDYTSTMRAVGVSLIAWVFQVVILILALKKAGLAGKIFVRGDSGFSLGSESG